MNLIQRNDDGSVVVEFTQRELGVIGSVGLELLEGAFSLSDEEWNSTPLAGTSREEAAIIFDALP